MKYINKLLVLLLFSFISSKDAFFFKKVRKNQDSSTVGSKIGVPSRTATSPVVPVVRSDTKSNSRYNGESIQNSDRARQLLNQLDNILGDRQLQGALPHNSQHLQHKDRNDLHRVLQQKILKEKPSKRVVNLVDLDSKFDLADFKFQGRNHHRLAPVEKFEPLNSRQSHRALKDDDDGNSFAIQGFEVQGDSSNTVVYFDLEALRLAGIDIATAQLSLGSRGKSISPIEGLQVQSSDLPSVVSNQLKPKIPSIVRGANSIPGALSIQPELPSVSRKSNIVNQVEPTSFQPVAAKLHRIAKARPLIENSVNELAVKEIDVEDLQFRPLDASLKSNTRIPAKNVESLVSRPSKVGSELRKNQVFFGKR